MGPVSEFTNLVEEQHGGQQRGRTVGNRHRHPDTQRTEMRRQNKEQRMRNSICRVRERKIALCGLPIYWKKLEVTIWNPTIGKTHNTIRSPSAAVEIIRSAAAPSAASTKSIATCRGKSCPSRNPVVVTQTAHTTVCRRTFNTRSYRRRRNCTPRWAACLIQSRTIIRKSIATR